MSEVIKSTPASEIHKQNEQNIALQTIVENQTVTASNIKDDTVEVVESSLDTMAAARKAFWKNGLSIDETKTSALIICLFIVIIFACVHYHYMNDISNNLKDIIETLIYAIAGINIFSNVAEKFGTNKSDKK